MNKEEIYQSIEHIAKCEMYDAIEVKYLKSKFEELQQENKQLREVIDKAKEYIESKEYQYGDEEQDNYNYDIGFDEVNELLDILKEENHD